MSNPKILVPIDFTRLSDKVIEQAAILSTASNADLVLLHCTDRSDDLDSVRVKIAEKAKKASVKYNVTCDSKVVGGSIFKMIPAEAEVNDYRLMVIGTHGVRGLKQKLLGADILKLVTKVPVPTLVVQSTSPFRRSFDKIILPVATHLEYENIVQAVINIGKLFNAEVHIYSIERQGFKAPEQLKKNLLRTISLFDENGIRYTRVNEKQTVISIGFAFQTLQYAQKINADMIAIMSVSSEEYHYFAKQDKENLLTNESGIPVLCASNLSSSSNP
jgi:nucleotide-binding universal stress UspA family protein